jgi:acetyl esterase/lipase
MNTRQTPLHAPCIILAACLACAMPRAHARQNQNDPVTVRPGISYLQTKPENEYAKTQCQMDLYLPQNTAKPFPLLVWFHGGALKNGSKTDPDTVRVARSLASRGAGVAVAGYRMNPKVKYPVYIQDAAQAVRWAAEHAASIGARPEVYAGGHSAGAYLAAMLAMDSKYLDEAGVKPQQLAGFIPMSARLMTHYVVAGERGLGRNAITADEAAPIRHIRKNHPPLLLLVGENDAPARLEENRYFHAALTKIAGSDNATLVVIPDRNHGSILRKTAGENDPAAEAILKFLQAGN